MPGYGLPPSVTISHSSTPKDHLGENRAEGKITAVEKSVEYYNNQMIDNF